MTECLGPPLAGGGVPERADCKEVAIFPITGKSLTSVGYQLTQTRDLICTGCLGKTIT